MSKELILPSDTKVIEVNKSRLTVCSYEDGVETSEVAFLDNPDKPGEVMLRSLVVLGLEIEATDRPDIEQYPYTLRVAKLALAQFDETGNTDLLEILKR